MLKGKPTPEAALVRAAAACSDRAFERLIDNHRAALRVAVGRFAENREDREDLEAEILARLLDGRKRALRQWEERAPFSAYLSTIGSRHCMRWRKHRAQIAVRTVPRLGPPSDDRPPGAVIAEIVAAPAEEGPEANAMRREVGEWVNTGVERLSPRDRLVLGLRFREGLDGPAIARVLDVSHNAANLAVFKALRRLERLLAESGDERWDLVGGP